MRQCCCAPRENTPKPSLDPRSETAMTINYTLSVPHLHSAHFSLHDFLCHEQTLTPFQYFPCGPLPFSRPRSCSEVRPTCPRSPSETSGRSGWRGHASSVCYQNLLSPFFLTSLPAWKYAINLNPVSSPLHLSSQVSRKRRLAST